MRRLPLLSLQVQPVPGVSNYGQANLALRSNGARHTSKPGDEAQTLVPSVLKIAALSILPVPTRLWGG